MTSSKKISVRFVHGLGDCVHFAHLVAMYVKRGFDVEIECEPDKEILFVAAGATITAKADVEHKWSYPHESPYAGFSRPWQGSKLAANISRDPLPDIGKPAQLWEEYCGVMIDLQSHISSEEMERANDFLSSAPGPIILLHVTSGGCQSRKSLPDSTAREMCREILERTGGSIILLDWNDRPLPFDSYRLRHLREIGACPLETLVALQAGADLMAGVDSGPLHCARFSDIPCVGLWAKDFSPVRYTTPCAAQINLVCADWAPSWHYPARIPFRIVECAGAAFTPLFLANAIVRMLMETTYCHSWDLARDVQLSWLINERSKAHLIPGETIYRDRNFSLDCLFASLRDFHAGLVFVETGTMRGVDDFGAGCFTYIAATFLLSHGGLIFSVDIDAQRCEFARKHTCIFDGIVTVENEDSVAYLSGFPGKIDVLYLDSLDTDCPGHSEHCLEETIAALPKMSLESFILIDDTPFVQGRWQGKGAMAIPYLIGKGWRVVTAGYQVLLARSDNVKAP